MKKFILILTATVGLSFTAFAEEPAGSAPTAPTANGPKQTRQQMKKEVRDKIKAKREMVHAKVMEACGPEMQTAGCAGKEGGDMMQCMRTYKEAHPEFKPSDACREAHGERREFRKEAKQMRKDMHHKIHQSAGGTPTIPPASETTK